MCSNVVVHIVQRGQPVGRPGDGVGLARTGAVLYEIIAARAVLTRVGHQLAHRVQLVKAGEDELFPDDDLLCPVGQAFFFFRRLQVDELLQYVHHAVLPEHIFPQIGGGIAVRVRRVALAAVPPRAGAALVEGQEVVLARQLGGHPHVEVIHGEIAQYALVELEAQLPRVAVGDPLALAVVGILAGVLVFQLEGEHGDAVHRQHHVHALVALGGVEPLAVAADLVRRVKLRRRLIQARLRLEIAHAEGDAPVLEAVAQHRHQAVRVTGVVKGADELCHRVDRVRALETRPGLGLGAPHKPNQRFREHPQPRVVHILVVGIPTLRGEQEDGDVGFKALFCGIGDGHGYTSLLC